MVSWNLKTCLKVSFQKLDVFNKSNYMKEILLLLSPLFFDSTLWLHFRDFFLEEVGLKNNEFISKGD